MHGWCRRACQRRSNVYRSEAVLRTVSVLRRHSERIKEAVEQVRVVRLSTPTPPAWVGTLILTGNIRLQAHIRHPPLRRTEAPAHAVAWSADNIGHLWGRTARSSDRQMNKCAKTNSRRG
jgi:hypothetical protein